MLIKIFSVIFLGTLIGTVVSLSVQLFLFLVNFLSKVAINSEYNFKNFSEILDYHNYHRADATMAVRIFERSNPFGVIDHDGILIKQITEKPIYKTTINSGIYVIEPKQIKTIQTN